ncbi:ankyrin repeat-containing domain protein [Dunaliella salina]|uniref:Ankyrin repeat-containing domain protein n=1 Tax=Dunaliella salina TaxID=3046 RepID=A0ABQ7GJH8_DUNSA|nr:ankyrin repeat-containing domain protein [Dunaliella salina]|eukprot:KAF5834761.1 ankyrin repeat-containing domain protein [Dunaliella salina]
MICELEFSLVPDDGPLKQFPVCSQKVLLREDNINRLNEIGQTPLYAAVNGQCTCKRPDKCVSTLLGVTALKVAAAAGNIQAAKTLIKFGADVNKAAKNNCAPLVPAAQYNHPAVVQLLLEKGAAVDCRDIDGSTPLLLACEKGCLKAAEMLISKGANVNAQADTGTTPLMATLHTGCQDIFNMLLSKDVDATLANKEGYTALSVASSMGHVDVVRALLKHAGAAAGVNHAAQDGETPLMASIKGGFFSFVPADKYLEISRMLLQYGANVNAQMDALSTGMRGQTCLGRACFRSLVKHVRLLLDHCADVNLSTKCGTSPLFFAAQSGNKAICQMLLDAGASVDITLKGYTEVAKLLIEKGANVNVEAADNTTPLLMACVHKRMEIVKLLLAHDAAVGKLLSDEYAALRRTANVPESILQLLLAKKAEQAKQAKNRRKKENRQKASASEPGPAAVASIPPSGTLPTAPESSTQFNSSLNPDRSAPPTCLACGSGQPGLKICSGCKSAYFCNDACSKAAWPCHKASCKNKRQG